MDPIQQTLFGDTLPPGTSLFEVVTIPHDYHGGAHLDDRKRWMTAHAGEQVTVLHRRGMQLEVRAQDGSTGIVLTTEVGA